MTPTLPLPLLPDFIFAPLNPRTVTVPVETLQPWQGALDSAQPRQTKDHDFQPVFDHIFADAKHAGKTVLILLATTARFRI